MRITANLRTRPTPQTDRLGRALTDITGEPVYTRYLSIGADRRFQIQQHMRLYLEPLARAMREMGIDDFASGAGIDLQRSRQIDHEPRSYTWLDRFEMVYERLTQLAHQDLTQGIIDQYNSITGEFYRNMGAPADQLEHIRIQVEPWNQGRVRSYLSPDLFDTRS